MESFEGVQKRSTAIHLFFTDNVMLFSGANDDQIACIKDGPELFYRASRQKVNFHKSKMFYSPFISECYALRMSISLGIPLQKNWANTWNIISFIMRCT